MAEDLKKGDHVTWNSHGGQAEGTVDRKITTDTEAAGRTVRASPEDDPQYEVTSEKSGGTAVHKPARCTRTDPTVRHRRTRSTRRHCERDRRPVRRHVRAEHQAQRPARRRDGARDPGDGAVRQVDPRPGVDATPSRPPRGSRTSTSSPADTLVGGTPVGMDADAVVARAELARWLDRADFPSTGPASSRPRATTGRRTPWWRSWRSCPDGETYERIGDVVRALGYPTET